MATIRASRSESKPRPMHFLLQASHSCPRPNWFQHVPAASCCWMAESNAKRNVSEQESDAPSWCNEPAFQSYMDSNIRSSEFFSRAVIAFKAWSQTRAWPWMKQGISIFFRGCLTPRFSSLALAITCPILIFCRVGLTRFAAFACFWRYLKVVKTFYDSGCVGPSWRQSVTKRHLLRPSWQQNQTGVVHLVAVASPWQGCWLRHNAKLFCARSHRMCQCMHLWEEKASKLRMLHWNSNTGLWTKPMSLLNWGGIADAVRLFNALQWRWPRGWYKQKGSCLWGCTAGQYQF